MKSSWALAALLLAMAPFSSSADQEKSKESYVKKTEKRLQSTSDKVQSLQHKAETAGFKTREELDRELKIVQEKLDIAHRKLTKVEGSSEESWKHFRHDVDEALLDVKAACEKAASLFNKTKTKEGKP